MLQLRIVTRRRRKKGVGEVVFSRFGEEKHNRTKLQSLIISLTQEIICWPLENQLFFPFQPEKKIIENITSAFLITEEIFF